MSFFKKLSAEIEAFMGDKDDKKEKKEDKDKHSEATRGVVNHQYGYPAQQYSSPPPAAPSPYGGAPPSPHGGYGAPPPTHQGYAGQPSYGPPVYGHDGQQAYYAPPPFPPPVPGPSQCPPGYVARFDENYKTWYYVNEQTRVSQWHHPSAGAGMVSGDRSMENHGASHGYYAAPPHDAHGYDSHSGGHGYDPHGGHYYEEHKEHKEKKDKKDKKDKDGGNTDVLVAGAAGLVIGGAAGALIAHEMTEDSNEEAAERAAEAAQEAQEESSSDEEEEED